MANPDLHTEEGRMAYRKELRRVAWPVRVAGFALIVLGALSVMAPRWVATWPDLLVNGGYALLAAGWALFLAAIFIRTRYHRRRMAEGL